MKKLLIVAAIAALACVGMAQGGGGGRGGMRMMMGGRGGGGTLMMALRDDVAKEIALTAEQRTKLEDLRDKGREEMQSTFESMRGNDGPPSKEQMDAMRTKMMAFQEKQNKEVAGILTADQIKRLKELRVQRAGIMSILDPEIQADLGMTDAQKNQVKSLTTKQQEAMSSIMERMRNQEIDRSEIRPLMEKNNKIMETELAKILTAEQKTKLEAMKGKPFTFEEEDGPGGQ